MEIFAIRDKTRWQMAPANCWCVSYEKINHIKIKRRVGYKQELHPDDSISTFLIARKLKQEDINFVLVNSYICLWIPN